MNQDSQVKSAPVSKDNKKKRLPQVIAAVVLILVLGASFFFYQQSKNAGPTAEEIEEIKTEFVRLVTEEVKEHHPKSESISVEVAQLDRLDSGKLAMKYKISYVEDASQQDSATTRYEASANLTRSGDGWAVSDVNAENQEIVFEKGIEIRVK